MKSILEMDAQILLSFVNTRLRNGQTIDELCEDMDVERRLIDAHLFEIGYYYDPEKQRFIAIQKATKLKQ